MTDTERIQALEEKVNELVDKANKIQKQIDNAIHSQHDINVKTADLISNQHKAFQALFKIINGNEVTE
jgi:FtsZ-binding cell division protein ZapB